MKNHSTRELGVSIRYIRIAELVAWHEPISPERWCILVAFFITVQPVSTRRSISASETKKKLTKKKFRTQGGQEYKNPGNKNHNASRSNPIERNK